MTIPSHNLALDLKTFSGRAPLFPLPETVLFPEMSLPLHIFEPRYRQMTAHALASDRLIAMALLKPGWELCESQTPAIHEMVCIGRIVTETQLPDGRYNLILRGLQRAVVISEVTTQQPYRIGQLELYRDLYPQQPGIDHDKRRRDLLFTFRRLFPQTQVAPLFAQLLSTEIPLGALSDIIGTVLHLPAERKQLLLDEVDVETRSEMLLRLLREACLEAGVESESLRFPPPLSLN